MGHVNLATFYTYQGSLTTPPCSQAVTWIIFPQAIDVSSMQMDNFRILTDRRGENIVNNYRFLQPKGKRLIYFRGNVLAPVEFDQAPIYRDGAPATPGPLDNEELLNDI